MTLKKRLLSVALAATVALTAMPMYTATAGLDLSYDDDDYIDSNLFLVNGEWNDKVLDAIEKAAKKDYDELTYRDIEKITALDLSGMELTDVPDIIQYMFRLRTLDLSENLLCSEALSGLDFSNCINLTTIDVSDNYLMTVPAWLVALDATKKDISDNLIGTTNQRYVQLSNTTYYYVIGDTINENELKDKILSTLQLNDGTQLPEFFYDPDLPTYNIPEEFIEDESYERNKNVTVSLDITKFVNKEGVVTAKGNVSGTAGLVTTNGNPNVKTKFTIYFLDGSDPTSIKVRLESLIDDCGDLDKNNYTTSSWAKYEAALKTAEAIITYPSADTDMLTNALGSLSSAKDALVEGVSADTKKTLNSLISISKSFNSKDYSTSSWKAFEKAVEAMQKAIDDPEASINEANNAIKAYQRAQAGLTATMEAVPAIITKDKFDAIYGIDKSITAKGVTRGGVEYSWYFNGTDIKTPADFNPEISLESEFEESIRYEVGSANDYQLISFTEKGEFPGTAVVILDVSDVYEAGIYRLYKWNKENNKSEFIKEVEITDGITSFTINNGGDYFISSVLQNFQMISSNFDINHEKLTISSTFKKKYTVADFRNSIENGEAVTVLKADGTETANTDYIATGMTATAANSDVSYTIVVPGDNDGDGNVTVFDAVNILRAVIREEGVLPEYAHKVAADVTNDGWIRADDAVEVLKYCTGME